MTDWPSSDGILSFEDLTNPICEAIRTIYTLKKHDYGDIKWTGPALPKFLAVTCLTFDERLTKAMLDYDAEDQGREPLEVLVGMAVQLGMEQERRMKACSGDNDLVDTARSLLRRRFTP